MYPKREKKKEKVKDRERKIKARQECKDMVLRKKGFT